MHLHGLGGLIGVAQLQPVDDCDMLAQHHVKVAGQGNGQAPHPVQLGLGTVDDLPDMRRCAKGADHRMKSLVQRVEAVIILIGCHALLLVYVEVDRPFELGGHAAGGQTHDLQLQRVTHQLAVEHRLQIDFRDIGPGIGHDRHQVFCLQLQDRFAQGCAGDAKLLTDQLFIDVAARCQMQVHNGIAHDSVDLCCLGKGGVDLADQF